ncbi:sugar transferase [Facklamia sp. DSM 111018]|uniref:Sugar transferase n=1 Tax=Facklamia lactis TaxID=2749967 RepID=A0ABS0LML7_9LACT|nr:sugar transferase [Facklamia lactis]MBG9979947.1 sugar transferase [Facklamia lactis]MBG9985373.1 sugar transferase [Facklamia lactis]
MYIKFKRIIDIILSFIALVLLSPLFIFLACWIKIDSKGPVFFKQKRIGIHRSNFYIYKFRSMRSDAPKDTPTHMLKNPKTYITHSGHFLRKTSIDELPQLINILKGEMAFVGPRPALWNQYDLADERDKYGANDVLPGLTGWAQINGRDELPIPEKAALDGYYIENMSLIFDIKCLIGTVISVVKSDGVVEGGTGTLESNNEDE